MPVKPMSLPPMLKVTTWVSASRASNWGGFGPGVTPCGAVMSSVSAPEQVTSRNAGWCELGRRQVRVVVARLEAAEGLELERDQRAGRVRVARARRSPPRPGVRRDQRRDRGQARRSPPDSHASLLPFEGGFQAPLRYLPPLALHHRPHPQRAAERPARSTVHGRVLGRHRAALDQRRRAALLGALAGGVRARAARPGAARAGARLRVGRARRRRHGRGAGPARLAGSRRRWTARRAPGWRSRPPAPAACACPRARRKAELRPRGKRHSRERDARAVRHHYDLPPEFFELFLGPSMTYSCAVFSRGATTLEEAQETKLEMVCTKLDLKPGQRVLDIGCGWGSFAIHAAERHGVKVVGITLSPPQAERRPAPRRRAAGCGDRVDIRVADYRELADEPFDAVASIGMVEHVGANQIDVYARQVARLVKPGGPHPQPRHRAAAAHRRRGGAVLRALRVPRRRAAAPVAHPARAGARGASRPSTWRASRSDYATTLEHWARNLDANLDGRAAAGRAGAPAGLAALPARGPPRVRERLHLDLPGARTAALRFAP